MKTFLPFAALITITFTLSAQTIDDLTFGTDSSLDIMTWNIEWFPKNGNVTVDYVSRIIEALDVDVIAIQEVSDTIVFKEMLANLVGYEGYFKSSWFAGLAYIYKTETVHINDIYEIYTTSPYWSPFPRSPMVMEMSFENDNYIIINNHFKCCGDGILNTYNSGDEETRRLIASNLLKEYIDSNFPNEKVILLGDLNDILTDHQNNNVFQAFFDDELNYFFADIDIAGGEPTEWSYPSWPSHIDHILVTNELFESYESDNSGIQTIKIEDYVGGWGIYDSNISDHRPVAIKITPNIISNIKDMNPTDLALDIYPNPTKDLVNISFSYVHENVEIEIYTIGAKKVYVQSIPKGETSIIVQTCNFPDGVYFVKLISNGNTVATEKLILNK